jgi:hypothetical protein
LLDYDTKKDEVWVYQRNIELQKWKFNGEKLEQYNTRFYQTPEFEPIAAEIHSNYTKLSVVTFNEDLSNPKYSV